MRHQKNTVKLGRKEGHRKSMLSNLACSLIEHSRIKTTLAKAKAVKPMAEKMVTLGKKKTLHARRTALAVLRQANIVKILFDQVAPRAATRKGGYTRIVKLGQRISDASEMCFIEWVDSATEVETATPEAKAPKKVAEKKATEKVATEKKVVEKKAPEKVATEKVATEKKPAAPRKPAAKKVAKPASTETESKEKAAD
jgi:large subunit ribosomal protein L17